MKNVVLFKEITTEEALQAIEKEALSYEGLHVEMSDPEQRKFIKNKLSEFTDIAKKVDRARIDQAKKYKSDLDSEAQLITNRLAKASEPFQLLLDEWKIERQKILDHKKKQEEEAQKVIDHEDALMYNKVFDIEKREQAEKLAVEKERERLELIAESERKAKQDAEIAKAKAKQDLIDAENKRLRDIEREKQRAIDAENARIEQEAKAKQDAIDAEKRRLADIERTKQEAIKAQQDEANRIAEEKAQREANQAHVTSVCKAAKESLMQQANLTESQAIVVVKAIRSGLINSVNINF